MSFFTLCIQNSHYFENFSSFFSLLSKNIPNFALGLSKPVLPCHCPTRIGHRHPIKDMAKHAINMVNMSIEAFVKKDMQMAQGVKEEDEIVDNLFRLMRSDLIESIRQNTSGDEQAIDVFMIAKYLEKIADHAVNVAGWVIFSMTGEHIDKIINS